MPAKKRRNKPSTRLPSDESSVRRCLAKSEVQSIINAYPANVVLLDHKGSIRYANAAWRRFAEQKGMPSDSYGIGLNYLKLCREDEAYLDGAGPSVAKNVQQLLAGEAVEFSRQYGRDSASGRQRIVVSGRRVMMGRSGAPYFMLTHEAVTRRILNAIETRDNGVKQLLESTPFVPWEGDAKTRRFTYVGPQVEMLLEYPQASWYEPGFWITNLHPEDRARTIKAYRELSGRQTHYELRYRMIAKTGRAVWLRDFVTVETRPGQPKISRGFLVDVTTFAKLEERETLLHLLSESIDEIFWFVEVNPERLVYISPAVEKIMGWKPEKFYENAGFWLECIHEDDRSRVKEAYSGWLSRILPEYRIEFRIKLPDGRIRWMADHGALLYGERGRITFATGIAKDISAQKQAEEDLRRLSGQLISAQEEERKRLARDLHDHVSQALTLLSVEVEQLTRDEETTTKQQSFLGTMRHQLSGLSSDLHALSHQLHPSKLTHLGLVSAMRAMCREMERGGLTVKFSDHEVPRKVPDDVSLTLYRVMQEGLQNTRKHSGTTNVEAELRRTSRVLILRLRDKGKGFDPNTINSGEGLGLSSMRERLNAVRGTLIIQSTPGQGTLVEASVPLPGDGNFK